VKRVVLLRAEKPPRAPRRDLLSSGVEGPFSVDNPVDSLFNALLLQGDAHIEPMNHIVEVIPVVVGVATQESLQSSFRKRSNRFKRGGLSHFVGFRKAKREDSVIGKR
jgi:hypothetical protein